eukprot:8743196-Pyramimonas_sp.AAC.1
MAYLLRCASAVGAQGGAFGKTARHHLVGRIPRAEMPFLGARCSGKSVRGAYKTLTCSSWLRIDSNGIHESFMSRMRKRFGTLPNCR